MFCELLGMPWKGCGEQSSPPKAVHKLYFHMVGQEGCEGPSRLICRAYLPSSPWWQLATKSISQCFCGNPVTGCHSRTLPYRAMTYSIC